MAEEAVKENLLPVSLLCGFLGAGKTTLLKHVLETKHSEEDFKCAVIVNDMAALNIDKSLIDQSALVQTDEVIAMQNGCFCCTLQSDLVDQIIGLAKKNMFNYMLIEASGVSEPSQIAPLFDLCDDDHDHLEEHKEGPQLGEVARLDTCVTVIDAAEFHGNLESMRHYNEGESQGSIVELMVEQVEFSNVVILNKTDLVNAEQQEDILQRISILNPKAKVLKSCQSKINVMEILDTNLYSKAGMEDNSLDSVIVSATDKKEEPSSNSESCCKESLEKDGKKCCKSKPQNGDVVDTGLSKITLGVVSNNNERVMTRHESRFGISSFIYRSRRPFHPVRLNDHFLDPLFMTQFKKEDIPEASALDDVQKEAASKQNRRRDLIGGLMRSKGFVWLATSNFFMGAWQQAGNVLRVTPARPWLCEMRERWEGTPMEPMALKELTQDNGEEWPWGDRCQELVFIGTNLSHETIQRLLDESLLSDEEMELGPSQWQELWWDADKIKLPTMIMMPQRAGEMTMNENIISLEGNVLNHGFEEHEENHILEFDSSVSVTTVTPQVATTFVYDP